MDENTTLIILSALAQPTRLRLLKHLIRALPDSHAAGDIAVALDIPHNTFSGHVSILQRAGLVTAERQSRQIFYRAHVPTLQSCLNDLIAECCDGQPERCVDGCEVKPQ